VVSAAAVCAAILKDKTNAMVIGEETGGASDAHNASVMSFVLPETRIKLDIPLRRYYQPVKKRLKGRGVIPDKIIPFTVRGMIDNVDEPISYIFDSILVK
jgi:C-terminal processing protease CtpA/Prc